MIPFLFQIFVFVVCFSRVDAQSCKTPSGGDGDCVLLYDCKPLLALVNKVDRTSDDNKLLRDSRCGGYQGSVPEVCCPKPCYTPEGHEGKCVGLASCPHIVNMLKKPAKPENVAYVMKLVCSGPEERSVCCGPPAPPVSEPPGMVKNCNSVMTAFPPDRRTKCCGVDGSSTNKIVGGNVTGIDQHPWLVVIEYIVKDAKETLCGGSLISGKYVLTAGHCVAGPILFKGEPINVRLGEFNTTNTGPDCIAVAGGGIDCTDGVTSMPIEKTIPHPEYVPFEKKHDIALIRLKNTAPYTYFIRPICLPQRDYTVNSPPEFKLVVAGWGQFVQFKAGRGIYSDVKRQVQLPYVQREICQESHKKIKIRNEVILWKGQICAGGEPGKDSCKGDSGSPLMYESNSVYEAVGIVSFGTDQCGSPDKPGIYTNIYEYMPWITSTISLDT